MNAIRDSSRHVAKIIIKAVDEIAFRTNILALVAQDPPEATRTLVRRLTAVVGGETVAAEPADAVTTSRRHAIAAG